MPKIQQPSTLENLALNSSVQMLCLFGKSLMRVIKSESKQDVVQANLVLRKEVHFIRNLFAHNVPCYLYDRLGTQIFSALPDVIDRVNKGLRTTAVMSEFLCQVNVAVSLAEVLMSPFLRNLNFESMPKMLRHLFYTKLKDFSGLYYLNLSSLSGGWKTCEMEPTVLKGICSMRHLKCLVLNYDCTDNILELLQTACPYLETLDISSSKSITNNSVKYLIELENIRQLQLYRTGVTIEGYTRLLINLKYIEDVGRFDEIGRALELVDQTIHTYDEMDRRKLSLKVFVSRYVTMKHLQLLALWCPEITTVSLFHNPLINDLMFLIPINKLMTLKLLSCDFFGDQVRDVLQVKGCNLTHLHFEHVDQIDMNALIYISQYCPDLKSLTIYNCDMVESTSLYTRKYAVPPFLNLEKLVICATCTYGHLEFLLSYCFKIKFIHIGTMAPTNDKLFERIFGKNPFEYLEELRIAYSHGLSLVTACKLLEACPNLSVLSELENWDLINSDDFIYFKELLKSKNLDLNIKPLRVFKNHDDDDVA